MRSSCRGDPAPVRSQRTDEVTVWKREVSSQVTGGQARSVCRVGGGPILLDHRGQMMSQYSIGRCPVRSHRSDKFRVQRRHKVQPQLGGGGSHKRR